MKQNWTEIMLRALAHELTQKEELDFQQALSKDPSLLKQWEEMQSFHELLQKQSFALEPFLSTRVLARLDREEHPLSGLSTAFRALALPVLAAMLGLVLFTYVQEDQLNLEVLSGTADYSIEHAIASDWGSF
ncbi:MAG: hypothetical protein AAF804_15305 [Bacteroidota bacterium]